MDQEILDLLLNFDADLAAYNRKDVNSRFYKFMGKKNMKDHQVLPTRDGSTVIGPRGDFTPTNTYLVKYPNNGYYVGPLNGQNRQGFGYRTYADPELIYVGDYVNNLKSGKGKLWSRKEKRWVYDGSWANDVKNGYGEMWKNGVIYKGNWLNDKLDGIGRMDWPSGQTYEGSFAKDLRNGEGTMTFPNGDQYAGFWRNGRPHGKGSYMWKTGEVYSGNWVDGIMEGTGEIDYGIPVRGSGNVRDGSVQQLNYQLQRPEEWQSNIARSSQFIKSYRETIIPESIKRSLKVDVTSSVGAAGFGNKAPPANLNFSYAPDPSKPSANTGSYQQSTTGYNANASNYGGYSSNAKDINYTTKEVTYNTGGSNFGYSKDINANANVKDLNANYDGAGYGINTGSSGVNYQTNLGNAGTSAGPSKFGQTYEVSKTSYAVGPTTVQTTTVNDNSKANNPGFFGGIANSIQSGINTITGKNEDMNANFKQSGYSYDIKNSNVPLNQDGYKTSTASYQVSGPGKIEFGNSNAGNLRVNTDINSENIAYNANRQPVTYTTETRQVRYN